MKSIGTLSELEELSLYTTLIGEELAEIKKLDRLRVLDLTNAKVGDSDMSQIGGLSALGGA